MTVYVVVAIDGDGHIVRAVTAHYSRAKAVAKINSMYDSPVRKKVAGIIAPVSPLVYDVFEASLVES